MLQFFSPNITGVDGYFHARYSQILLDKGLSIFDHFSWLQYSIWNKFPADLSFFYHVVTAPFTLLGALKGLKVVSAIFSALVFVTFFYALNELEIKHPLFWLLVLSATSSSFLFRLSLPRPFVFSISLFLLGVTFILTENKSGLFMVSFFYALSYSGSPIILAITVLYSCFLFFYQRKLKLAPVGVVVAGMLFAFLLRPDFPNNLKLIFYQDLMPFVIKLKHIPANLGAELSPFYSLKDWSLIRIVSYLLPAGFLISCVETDKNEKEQFQAHYLLFLFVLILVLTFTAGRFIEYLAPLGILAMAFLWDRFFEKPAKEIVVPLIKKARPVRVRWRPVLLVLLIGFLLTLFGANVFSVRKNFSRLPADYYKDAALWLKKNIPAHTTVYNVGWEDFPQLFYYNPQNFYIIGMDPTFLYYYNKELYWPYYGMSTRGVACQNRKQWEQKSACFINEDEKIKETIESDFNADYIFLSTKFYYLNQRKHVEMANVLSASPEFELVFQDEQYPAVLIYKIRK